MDNISDKEYKKLMEEATDRAEMKKYSNLKKGEFVCGYCDCVSDTMQHLTYGEYGRLCVNCYLGLNE